MNSSARIPLLFVFLWSSAFIAFEFCADRVEPATFVVLRNEITAIVLFLIVFSLKIEWPKRLVDILYSVLVGVLLHGVYACSTFASVHHGIDIRLCALILSLQPLVTILLSSMFLGEKITPAKVFGILAGLIGVSIVILQSSANPDPVFLISASNSTNENSIFAISLCFIGLVSISVATIIQKRYCSKTKVLPDVCIQYTAAALFLVPIAVMFESMQINWNLNLVFGLGWLIVFVSISAMPLLMTLIKRGEAGAVANLFYLVTPLVAIEAWILFGKTISLVSLGGMLLCMTGVVVANCASAAKPGAAAVRTGRKKIIGIMVHNFRIRVDYVR